MAPPNTAKAWIGPRLPPLFSQQISDLKIEVKLAQMNFTINEGADVDGLDTQPDPYYNHGRPLHFASDITRLDSKNLKDNLRIVKLLLGKGADPRKPGMMHKDSALEEVKFSLKAALRNKRFQKEWKDGTDVISFLSQAFEEMKKAADRLDAEEVKKAAAEEARNGLKGLEAQALELGEEECVKEDDSTPKRQKLG